MTTKSWTVQVTIEEQGDDTYVDAVLVAENKTEIRGHGVSRRNPNDDASPQIGDELAAARAFSDLSHQLLSAAASDIEASTHRRVRSLAL